MYKSIILPLAQEDIREAAKWYNKRQEGLGKRFTAEIREKVHFLRQNPKASNVRYDDVRTAVLNVFPFMVHYTVDEKNNAIIVWPYCIQAVTLRYGKTDNGIMKTNGKPWKPKI